MTPSMYVGQFEIPCYVRASLTDDGICRWIPGTAKFVALGEYARNTGCLQVKHAVAVASGQNAAITWHAQHHSAVFCRSLSCKTTSFRRSRRSRSQRVSSAGLSVLAVCLRGNWQLVAFKGNYRSPAFLRTTPNT